MSDFDDRAVVIERRDGGAGTGIALFLLGAAIGAGAALLLAPRTGEETRAELRRGAGRLKKRAADIAEQGREVAGDLQRQGRTAVKDARSALEERLARHRDKMAVGDNGDDGI